MFQVKSSATKIFASAAAMVVVLLISTNVSFVRFTDLRNADQWDIHSYQVLLETNRMSRTLIDMQTSARWYAVTGHDSFLDSYNNGLVDYERSYEAALRITGDDAHHRLDLMQLRVAFADWKTRCIDPVIRTRYKSHDPVVSRRLLDAGEFVRKAKMDSMQAKIDAIEHRENELLQQRSNQETIAQQVAIGALLINGIFAVLLATALSLTLAGGARRLELLNERLRQQRDRLLKTEQQAQIFSTHNEMLLFAARDGIAGVNQAGRTTFFNPAAERITGYKADEVIGKIQHQILHEKYSDGVIYPPSDCPITATLRDGKVHHTRSETFRHKDGHPIDIEFTSAPLFLPKAEDPYENSENHGQQVGAVIMFRDIGEQKRAEEAQRELASIVQYSEDSIVAIDLNGFITRWNYASTKLYGYGANEIIGTRIQRLLPDEAEDDIQPMLDKIRDGEHIDRYEACRLRHDGSEIKVVVGLSPILDEEGMVVGASSISRQVFRDRVQRPIGAAPQPGVIPLSRIPATSNLEMASSESKVSLAQRE